jgi:glycosyltransferase involved in cell wall biosynthesis
MKISIIIPVYNEEKHISKCLTSILKNKINFKNIEILIIDGGSTDKTVDIIKNFQRKKNYIKLLNNPKRYQAAGLNLGIKKSRGEIIIRCDAHAIYPEDYLTRLIEYHKKNKADNIGGVWETIPADNSIKSRAIASSMNNIFGVGYSFRTIKNKGDIYSGTVPFGSFKKSLIKKIGLFDENLKIGEDLDYNIRIRKNKGRILMITDLIVQYIAKDNFKKLIAMSFNYGLWKTTVNKKHKLISSVRQLLPPLFLLLNILLFATGFLFKLLFIPLFLIIAIYFCACLIFSLSDTLAHRESIKYFFYLAISFIINHFFYGAGYIVGFFISSPSRKKINDFTYSQNHQAS